MLVMKSDTIFGRHAENLILVGPILEGLVGGLSTFNGVVHAYVLFNSCCTTFANQRAAISLIARVMDRGKR